LYADPPRFSPTLGGGVFRYLKYGLVAVAEVRDGEFEVATDGDRFPIVYSPDSVRGFFEKVGRNTRYIISPDEILADNVALALAGSDTPLSDPRLPADLLDIIQQSKEPALTRGRPATDDRLSRVTLP
jgi:hypothetical protein